MAPEEAGLETLWGVEVLTTGVTGAEATTGEVGVAEAPSPESILVPEADNVRCKFVEPRVDFAVPATAEMGVE
jgi:hypothetical protein